MDNLTRIFRLAFDVILLKYPLRTGLGILLGITFDLIARLLLYKYSIVINIEIWHLLALGVLTVFLPIIIRGDSYNETVDSTLELIDKVVEKGGLSKTQKKLLYWNYINKLINLLEFDENGKIAKVNLLNEETRESSLSEEELSE